MELASMLLEQIYYTVNSLEGDYAYLKKEEDASEDLKCVARALLPGSSLPYASISSSPNGIY